MISVCIVTVNAGTVIENAVSWALAIANDNSHGYSQLSNRRWGNPDYDCSSFVITAFKNAGCNVGAATYTGNMRSVFVNAGFTWIPKSQINLSNSSQLQRGDILLNEKNHTEIYIGNNQRVGAHTGTYDIYDRNAPGDNNGKEISIYNYSNSSNWDGVLRYNENPNFPGEEDTSWVVPVWKTANSKLDTYDSNGNKESGRWIDAGDNCYIEKVYQNGYAWVKYPTSNGDRWAYAKASGFSLDKKQTKPIGTQTISDGEYHIVSALDNTKALDVANAVTNNGANINLYSNLDDPAQVFTITYLGDGYYKIINNHSKKSIDVDNLGTTNGTNVKQWEDNGSDAQKWVIKESGDGQYFYIISKCNGLYLDVSGGIPDNGTNVQMYGGNESNSQKWKFVAWGNSTGQTIADGEYHIISGVSNDKGLDIYCALSENCTNIDIYSNVTDSIQIFKVTYIGKGYYKIISKRNSKSLDCASGNTTSGTNVQLYSYEGVNQQQWIIKSAGNGYYYIISKNSGLYLDVENGLNKDFTNVQVYVGNNTVAQKWKFVSYITDNEIKLSDKEYIYDGKAKTPNVTVKNDTATLVKDTDYTVEYSNNTNAGTATVTVKGIGNYTGTLTKTFTINKAPQTINATISSNTLNVGDTSKITASSQGTISYSSSNTNVAIVSSSGIVTGISAGTATITVTAAGNSNYNSASKTLSITVKEPYLLGDLNSDGEVSIDDVTLLQKYLAENSELSETQISLADVNGDGDVMIDDVTMIQKYLAGAITKLG